MRRGEAKRRGEFRLVGYSEQGLALGLPDRECDRREVSSISLWYCVAEDIRGDAVNDDDDGDDD